MATYFHGGPDVQSDGLQTLYLMNPGYVGYPDAAVPANMLLLNSTINSMNPMGLSHSTQQSHHHHHHHQQQHHFVGVPLQSPGAASHDSGRQPSVPGPHDISAVHGFMPRAEYNLWAPPPGMTSVDLSAQLGPHRPSAVPAASQQGLSLSLSPQHASYSYRPETEVQAAVPAMPPATAKEGRATGSSSSVSVASTGMSGLQSVLMGSKYLKVAQQLLEEVVNVGKGVKSVSVKRANSKSPAKTSRDSDGTGDGDTSSKPGADLTTAERQELQMKKAKLVNMLDEVEQRYRQYHHQMQIVVSSFEAVAGIGSAKTYTALALQTISKQFRCLRDAIFGQIRTTSKSLGEEDCTMGGAKSEGVSGLRFVDHHLRQQRALQQLGMMQHNAWRPQRGLPERSVSILRAWLFEHFLHPYPKDSDKLMLAKQTGLTRSQVSNWFINARVRLWKPMVEEMYLEEVKEQEPNNGNENSKSDANEGSTSKSSAHQENSPARTEQTTSHKPKQDYAKEPNPTSLSIPPSVLGGAPNLGSYNGSEALMQPMIEKSTSNGSLHPNVMTHSMNIDMKTNEANNRELLMKFGDGRRSNEETGYPLITSIANNGGGFGAYTIGEMGRFDHEQFAPRFSVNGVSLTLGLPHSDNLSVSATQPSYLSSESIPMGRRLDMGTEANDYCSLNNSNPSVAQPSNVYESINIQRRKRFAAQLLPDFVA